VETAINAIRSELGATLEIRWKTSRNLSANGHRAFTKNLTRRLERRSWAYDQ
jgi:hypothetical protein